SHSPRCLAQNASVCSRLTDYHRNLAPMKPAHKFSLSPSGTLFVLAQVIAQRVANILGAHAAPLLKLRHDLGHEPLDGAWAIYWGQHEAVSSDGIDEGLHLIRNAPGSANELRQPDALAVSHSDLTNGHGGTVGLAISGLETLQLGFRTIDHEGIGRQRRQVEVEVGR